LALGKPTPTFSTNQVARVGSKASRAAIGQRKKARQLSATTVPDRIKTRTALREFVLSELPGWGPWLDLAAAEVQRDAWDFHLLKTEGELAADIRNFAAEFVNGIGPDAETLFLLFMQQLPARALHEGRGSRKGKRLLVSRPGARRPRQRLTGIDQPAIEEFTHARGELPFSHQDLVTRMPSRVLIGLIGALGLRQQWAASGKIKPGRAPDFRLNRAIEEVRQALLPFVKTRSFRGTKVGQPVAPERHQMDPTFRENQLRSQPLSIALVAVVAIYLSQPNRRDPESRKSKLRASKDSERLTISPSGLKETMDRFSALAKAHAVLPPELDLGNESLGESDFRFPPKTF
jgi:hypothetical protein